MKCFVCKNKIGLLDDKGFTQDHKFICYQDVNKLLNTDKARKHFVPADLKREINQMTSNAILEAINRGNTGRLFCPYCGSSRGSRRPEWAAPGRSGRGIFGRWPAYGPAPPGR